MIKVVNVKYASPGSFEYCGRKNDYYHLPASPLANPFRLRNDTPEEREKVLAQYRTWFDGQVENDGSAFCVELVRLIKLAREGDLSLGCYCFPKKCHCDKIKEFIELFL